MKRNIILSLFVILCFFGCEMPKNGHYKLNVLATTDIHGKYFDSTYVGSGVNETSLSNVDLFKSTQEY